ncbi:MAG: Peptidase M23B [Parcubacteria group bacterium GW2011_GWC1_43_11b]|uniref:M23ase beta-sheet core domain-containing protein n=1 Tax=Candidatus Vogelbacteria bacterium RIFOXYB1_FULL_42_16 TaxID=1802436 RepID=A0A1G2QGY9_9BACT|nr:MAG: Peptidase M23B [Parcubacteria group bacterium GW2011_GWB1_42_9]KKS89220.1 MAG: Peptidase M23B [Parcubacteria group bacterium GW2011_GWC1_43_11b]KKT09315.1 MAG: Peptidase M23B [Parcubacteria group bacterium GW2011_GWA1_43_21]OHA59282.1 MAG: hypothetical protein A2370_01900 [Candidatus Vogelbacteria bacterium RIFOXYB1_FULL_42_16]
MREQFKNQKKYLDSFRPLALIMVLVLVFGFSWNQTQAQTVDELKNKISGFEAERAKLDAEIKEIKTKLSNTKEQSATLKAELARIEATRSVLLKQIELTKNKIGSASLTINKLSGEIGQKKNQISTYQSMIAEALRNVNHSEEDSLAKIILADETLATLGGELAILKNIQDKLQIGLVKLRGTKKELEVKKEDKEIEKEKLVSLENQLVDEKKIVDTTKKSKDELLSITKSKESNYQKLLADRQAKMKAVLSEINKAEESLRIVLDPSLLPTKAKGVLAWPLDKIKITQTFGYTDFALKNASVYNGNGHNGVDFGASVGTPLKSAGNGKVIGAGDTDKTCQGASYGKWILIEHDNGLSTLYAHLSLIKVSEGQIVTTSQLIGYTGNTGYSTGPHLHFTVYASQGVKVGSLKSKVAGCGTYYLPLASPNSYLNPLNYL